MRSRQAVLIGGLIVILAMTTMLCMLRPMRVRVQVPVPEAPKSDVVVNIPHDTARCDAGEEYKQIGLLVSKDAEPPVILPLFGRKMAGSRDRYEYYTATDKIHLWKVAVQYEHRDCQDRLGCEQVYDGADIVVPDYANKEFKASIYKN